MHPRLSVEKPIVNWVLVVCKPVKRGAASVLVFKVIVRYLRAERRVKELALGLFPVWAICKTLSTSEMLDTSERIYTYTWPDTWCHWTIALSKTQHPIEIVSTTDCIFLLCLTWQ